MLPEMHLPRQLSPVKIKNASTARSKASRSLPTNSVSILRRLGNQLPILFYTPKASRIRMLIGRHCRIRLL